MNSLDWTTGLDYWTGLLDSLKMWFSFVNTTLRADSYIARLYSKCVDKAFREILCYMEDGCCKNQDANTLWQSQAIK